MPRLEKKSLPKTKHSSAMRKVLQLSKVNKKIVDFQYAVRGAQSIRADELKQELDAKKPLPFKSIISCNIGNPQQLGQAPITFYRQVTALIEYPPLMKSKLFPQDTIERAKELLDAMGGSCGAYSNSQGIPLVRERIARFIEERDGYPANPKDIFLTAGASPGVQTIMNTIITGKNSGIMIPIPQYPLYDASVALYGGTVVPYYLDEEKDWSMTVESLQKAKDDALKQNPDMEIKALCVINPGNPTGQCLTEDTMKLIVEFCRKEGLVLMADEVYQANTYVDGLPFHSFKKVLMSMGPKYDQVELISFHSISKGMIGECGRRGGYFECVNVDQEVKDLFYKIASVSLCPPVQGQVMMELMVNPPKKGDPSFELFEKEHNTIYESLKRRAIKLAEAFNNLDGVTCNQAQGAMYLFPKITLPPKAIAAAKAKNMSPDGFYSMELLNATGVVVVPGSGFRQVEGTWHFRSTFLPPEDDMDNFISSIKVFHDKFMSKYK